MPIKADFQKALEALFRKNEKEGNSYVDIRAGDLHRQVGGYPGPGNRMPTCCNVMNENRQHGDERLNKPLKGKGASLEIRYALPRERDLWTRNAEAIKYVEAVESATENSCKALSPILVFSPCSSSKCEKRELPQNFILKKPEDYIKGQGLEKLKNTRQYILQDPRAKQGKEETSALDLYMKANSIAYKKIRECCLDDLRQKLVSDDNIQWFFLSGGYGVINALENANRYNASFRNSKDTWCTINLWRNADLSSILDAIVIKLNPSFVYIFGTPLYLGFIKDANFYEERSKKEGMKVFEGFGIPDRNAGLRWLSKPMGDLAEAVISGEVDNFNSRYNKNYYSNKSSANIDEEL